MTERAKSHVLVLSDHWGRMDRRILAEVNSLVAAGRKVTLASVPAEIPEDCLDRRVRVVMPKPGNRKALRSLLEQTLQKLPKRLYNIARDVSYFYGNGHAGRLARLFFSLAPPDTFDAIHCHDLSTLPAGIALRCVRSPKAKLIYDAHELYPFQFHERALRGYWHRTESHTIHQADAIIAVNHSIGRIMSRLYKVPPPLVLYNSYGVEADTCPPADLCRHFACDFMGPKILFQGNLSKGRNLSLLVEAMGKTQSQAGLFFLGDGELVGSLKAVARRSRASNVFFAKPVSQKLLLPLIKQADLGIIPYPADGVRNSKYCTPNKLFEFIEAGVPICSNELPELRRIIETYGLGGIYPMKSPGQIARAIDDCLERSRNGAFSEAGFESARRHFAWENQERLLVGLYDALGV